VREFVKLEKQLWQANGLDKKPIVGIEDAAELCKFVKLEKQFDKPSARLTKAESLNET
jgi:hypothetical protein